MCQKFAWHWHAWSLFGFAAVQRLPTLATLACGALRAPALPFHFWAALLWSVPFRRFSCVCGCLLHPLPHPGRWTKPEHEAFVEGLRLYGKEWKKVGVCCTVFMCVVCVCHGAVGAGALSPTWLRRPHPVFACMWQVAKLIPTRTVVQIRTHAQKYFQKLAKDMGVDEAYVFALHCPALQPAPPQTTNPPPPPHTGTVAPTPLCECLCWCTHLLPPALVWSAGTCTRTCCHRPRWAARGWYVRALGRGG
jgi:hypothetical protein